MIKCYIHGRRWRIRSLRTADVFLVVTSAGETKQEPKKPDALTG